MIRRPFITVVVLSLLLLACNGRSPNTGTLEVRLWDHREAIGDFSELWFTVSAVAIHPTGQSRTGGWIVLKPSIRELDLTQHIVGSEVVVAKTAVPAGRYNAVRLTVEEAAGILTDGQQVAVDVALEPVALDFPVSSDGTTTLGLDLVVFDVSDHPSGGYELHIREAILLGN